MLYIKNYGPALSLSQGLYYSAMTGRLGLRPMDEEYISMGMQEAGEEEPVRKQSRNTFVKDMQEVLPNETYTSSSSDDPTRCERRRCLGKHTKSS